LGFRNCIVAPKKPYLSEKHKLDRLKFACAHESWSFEDWCNVIWSNESSFELVKIQGKLKCGEDHTKDMCEIA
jgi:hypothetical protein